MLEEQVLTEVQDLKSLVMTYNIIISNMISNIIHFWKKIFTALENLNMFNVFQAQTGASIQCLFLLVRDCSVYVKATVAYNGCVYYAHKIEYSIHFPMRYLCQSHSVIRSRVIRPHSSRSWVHNDIQPHVWPTFRWCRCSFLRGPITACRYFSQ